MFTIAVLQILLFAITVHASIMWWFIYHKKRLLLTTILLLGFLGGLLMIIDLSIQTEGMPKTAEDKLFLFVLPLIFSVMAIYSYVVYVAYLYADTLNKKRGVK